MRMECKCQLCSEQVEFDASDAGKMAPCPSCGVDTLLFVPHQNRTMIAPVSVLPPQVALPPQLEMSGEPVFFQDTNLFVSKTRITVFGRMYAVANISSVQNRVIPSPPKNLAGPMLLVFLAIIMLAAARPAESWSIAILGVGFIVAAIIIGIKIKRVPAIYIVEITATSGERDSLQSTNPILIERATTAIHQAIAARG